MRSRTVIQRRARSTGTKVLLVAPGIEADESEGWLTICEAHAHVISHETRRLAESWMSHPEDWCEECMKNN